MDWIGWASQPEAWIALVTLTILEIVLGIDNIIFISIVVEKLPKQQQAQGRLIGLGLAMAMRVLLLLSISWVMKLKTELFQVPFITHDGHALAVTGKDLVLLVGGFFLLFKSTREIHHKFEEERHDAEGEHQDVITETGVRLPKRASQFGSVLFQIAMLDIIFSLDSVITAVGMAKDIPVMILAVMIAVLFMMLFSGMVARFINENPTLQMLALSFLILVGFALVADGLHFHVPKGYIYLPMAFSFAVEILNLRLRNIRRTRLQTA